MQRALENFPHRPVLDGLPCVHHRHVIREFAHDAEVADQQDGHHEHAAQVAQQLDDLVWIATSSAVVGSSATSRFGCDASAIVIITRCCMPPDIACG